MKISSSGPRQQMASPFVRARIECDSAESYAIMVQWRKFSALCAFLACIAALHTQAATTDNAAQHQVGAAASAAQPDNRHLWSPARVAARSDLLTLRLRGGLGGKSEPRKDNHKHHKGSNHEEEPVLCRCSILEMRIENCVSSFSPQGVAPLNTHNISLLVEISLSLSLSLSLSHTHTHTHKPQWYGPA
jgi:hypothetical protein